LRDNQAGTMPQTQVAQLFLEARDDVYRYLLSLGLGPAQAQEETQEVFLRLYVALQNGEEILNPRAWVFRVAHNGGLKIRARQKPQVAFDSTMETQLASPIAGPEQALLDRERAERFHSGIEDLSEQQRRCLFLRSQGLKYPEIGSVLGISPSAVGEFMRRAIMRLRKAVHG
jgi:RNA polymerase sigma-70 factor (ECF subfamily)